MKHLVRAIIILGILLPGCAIESADSLPDNGDTIIPYFEGCVPNGPALGGHEYNCGVL